MNATQMQMTAADFEVVVKEKFQQFNQIQIELARLMLVEGRSQVEASRAVGMTRQNAYHHMQRITAVLNDVPANWVYHSGGWMPDALATEFNMRIKEARAKAGLKII